MRAFAGRSFGVYLFWGKPRFDAAVAGVEPAAGDGFAAGEEVHAFGAVGVGIAEQRGFPAAEAVVGHRYRDGHVDADHADLDLVLEAPRRAAVVGEDRGAVAVGVGVDQLQRLVVGVHAQHREHRAEDLVGVHAHVGGDVIEQARAQPEPVGRRRRGSRCARRRRSWRRRPRRRRCRRPPCRGAPG